MRGKVEKLKSNKEDLLWEFRQTKYVVHGMQAMQA
jgi:hypothetical protein